MYKNEFDKNLKDGKSFNAYMFYGQCDFLVESYTQNIANSLGSSEEIEKIYYDDYNFKYCKDRLLQSSLFASKNILVIKLDKKLPKNEVTELINACSINKDSVVIFSCLGDGDFKAMGEYFSAKTNSVSVRFFAPFDNEAIKLLEVEAQKLSINYDHSALSHLYFMHKNDLLLCVNDLKKLSILNEHISPKTIDLHCFGFGSIQIDDFIQKLLKKEDISQDIYHLLEEGVNEIYLVTQITSFVQQLFMINAYGRIFGYPNAKEILGFAPPPKIWQDRCNMAIQIRPEKYKEILDYLHSLELSLKSSLVDDVNSFLQISLIKFKTILV